MSDTFTAVTRQSWFGRLRNAFTGILFGLLFLLGAVVLLFWNEGRAVKRHKTLEEGSGAVVSVAADAVDPARSGALVHLAGVATTDEVLEDPAFGVSARALRLRRRVEMYQWEEESRSKEKKKLGGGTETVTTYEYRKGWHEDLIDSDRFEQEAGHENPSSMPFASVEVTARNVTLGAFRLSPSLVGRIGGFDRHPVGPAAAEAAPGAPPYRVHEGGYYVGADPASPEVGDLKIAFSVVRPAEVSVVARQEGNSLVPYLTKAGGSIELLQRGVHAAASMFEAAERSNRFLAWVLRLVGFAVMLVGFSILLKPLTVLADVIPLLGRIAGTGTFLVSSLLALVLSLGTIAFAWVFFRPVLAIALLVVALGAAIWAIVKMRGA